MYDGMTYLRYALLAFFGISIIFPGRAEFFYRIFTKHILPYFYSLSPAALLVYALYLVSTRL